MPGENIPIVPLYGEWFYAEGQELYEGITRLAKDPQRLYNMQMSYLADIAAKGPRKKPFLYAEQVQGLEFMYESNTDDFPYYLLNRKNPSGEELPPGALGYMEQPDIPQATVGIIEQMRQAVADVTSPGQPQDVLDPDASGKAIMAVQNRIDMQSFVYLDNLSSSMRRDGEIYASMAAELYDTPREVMTQDLEGNESSEMVLESVQDLGTGEIVTLNDITQGRYDVFVDIGPNYQTQKQQARSEMIELYQSTDDPQVRNILMLQYLTLMDGSHMELLRKYANNQLVLTGMKEPANEEEAQALQHEDDPQVRNILCLLYTSPSPRD